MRPQPYSYRLPPDVVFAGGAGAGFHGKGIVSLRKRRPAFKKGPVCAGAQIGIFVGAEGGFSSEEAHLAQEVGATCTSLGNRILRCETAPLAALSAILYETDNF